MVVVLSHENFIYRTFDGEIHQRNDEKFDGKIIIIEGQHLRPPVCFTTGS